MITKPTDSTAPTALPSGERRYQNYYTRLGWMPQCLQRIEQDYCDAFLRFCEANGKVASIKGRGPGERETNAQFWEQAMGGQVISGRRFNGEAHFCAGLGPDVELAKKANVAFGIRKDILNQIYKKHQKSSNVVMANLLKMVSRALMGCTGLALHDQQTDMFVDEEDSKGLFGLVGLKSDGTRRQYNRLKSYMGKHLSSPELSGRLDDAILLLTAIRLTINGKDHGPLISLHTRTMISGTDLNANTRDHCVRGGQWQVARLNPFLMDETFKKFMQLDTCCFKLSDQDLNLFVTAKADHHFKYQKQTGLEAQTVLYKSPELIARSGVAQLTQKLPENRKTNAHEKKCLHRALTKMKMLGLIEDFEFIKPARKRDPDLSIRFPKREIIERFVKTPSFRWGIRNNAKRKTMDIR